ncbi:hypothetical protein HPB50_016447 [Hyalomma asiaticum]|uniref:Uncharacterized protein n=1 Tax=Hyalomma asiaticum TaxID=266040 RepID=A0ACB7SQR3_HYAAI|nr:hypothetical protein HPB50_016447 [Hyalomma asiaticum]
MEGSKERRGRACRGTAVAAEMRESRATGVAFVDRMLLRRHECGMFAPRKIGEPDQRVCAAGAARFRSFDIVGVCVCVRARARAGQLCGIYKWSLVLREIVTR